MVILDQNCWRQRFLTLRLLAATCRAYAWVLLKNRGKILLGRRFQRSERELFLCQYILHLSGLRPIRTITCIRRSGREGAGSQVRMVMNAINFARASGLTYVHTPFECIHHADRSMPEWVAAWETLFNLGAGEAACDHQEPEVVNYCYHWPDLEQGFGWRNRREALTRHSKAMIPLKTVTAVKLILDTQQITSSIRVYSQGDESDFAELSHLGVEFCLDADAIWTTREMIEADVLVMAKEFFSYYAALISDGIKIFHPQDISLASEKFLPSWVWMYLYPEDDWLLCQASGAIDPNAFERQLSLLMQAKANYLQMAARGRSSSS